MNDALSLLPQTGGKNKIKPRLPSDSSYPKWIFPNITSCNSDHRQRSNLPSRVLVVDRKCVSRGYELSNEIKIGEISTVVGTRGTLSMFFLTDNVQ
ncbi:hypothetical protein AVEN_196377-1 [Araneus ventricosus]|uniref:Uncharacterized protein n=1 Tax=Araneus ventricosus TaxID=182803 RepID=A0A4Y2AXE4_ARAVE|nr:hypothetical protein AVEN_196377-1 [Araneus ventricosus]